MHAVALGGMEGSDHSLGMGRDAECSHSGMYLSLHLDYFSNTLYSHVINL